MKKNSTLPIMLFTAVFSTLFACSKIEQIKKATTTTGLSWTQAATLSSSTVHKLAVSGNTVYAASSTGLYGSTDNGSTWTLVGGGLPTGDVNNIAVNGSNIYVGTSGVFTIRPIAARVGPPRQVRTWPLRLPLQ